MSAGRCPMAGTTPAWRQRCFHLRTRHLNQPRSPRRTLPPLHEQVQRHRHVTLQLVWEEYRDANPDGYGYSRFCELYQRWRKKLDVVLRQEHKAGEKGFVDWAGGTLPS